MNDTRPLNDPRHPSATKLREKYQELRESRGLQDVKFWYVGPTGAGAADDVSVDDLSAEVLTILEAYEKGQFVNIKDKLK